MKQLQLSKARFAMVDDDDFEWANQWKWYFDGQYAAREQHVGGGGERDSIKLYLHRELMQTPTGLVTDHIDRDKLNNVRSNLRICTFSENINNGSRRVDNHSGYRGVTWHKQREYWYARIKYQGKCTFLGSFKDKNEAAKAYDKASREIYGVVAYQNCAP